MVLLAMTGRTEGWIAEPHGSDVSRIIQFAEIDWEQWISILLFNQAKRQQRTSSPLYSLFRALYHLMAVSTGYRMLSQWVSVNPGGDTLDKLVIEGGRPLSGSIRIHGAKMPLYRLWPQVCSQTEKLRCTTFHTCWTSK